MNMSPSATEPAIIPSPTAADDKLTDEDRARGVQVMDPRWGFRMVVEPSGLLQPPLFDIDACQDCRNRLEINPYDVFVTTYPKCGTSWLQNIMFLLRRGSDAQGDPLEDSPWIEASASLAANNLFKLASKISVDDMLAMPPPGDDESGFRSWKTHSPIHAVPWKGGFAKAVEVGAKMVIVGRNPKDTSISMYHHTKKLPFLGFDGEWEQFAPLYTAGKVTCNSFWDWHRDWWIAKEAHPENILWLHYEDMKKDLEKEIRRIVDFLNLDKTDEEIKKVTERSTFSSMKAESSARNDGAAKKNHYRSGKAGGWVDVMSTETIAAFNANTEKMYSECSLRFKEKV